MKTLYQMVAHNYECQLYGIRTADVRMQVRVPVLSVVWRGPRSNVFWEIAKELNVKSI